MNTPPFNYKTIPIPMTWYTAGAALGLLLMFIKGWWLTILLCIVYWSLGGDGAVFRHALGMFREWKAARAAKKAA